MWGETSGLRDGSLHSSAAPQIKPFDLGKLVCPLSASVSSSVWRSTMPTSQEDVTTAHGSIYEVHATVPRSQAINEKIHF